MTTWRAIPYRKGNTIVREEYTEFVSDKAGDRTLFMVDYTDKQGKLHEGFVMRVQWEDN